MNAIRLTLAAGLLAAGGYGIHLHNVVPEAAPQGPATAIAVEDIDKEAEEKALREIRQEIGESNARKRGGDRAELAANRRGGIGLGIEAVDVTWPASQPEENAGDIFSIGMWHGFSRRQ